MLYSCLKRNMKLDDPVKQVNEINNPPVVASESVGYVIHIQHVPETKGHGNRLSAGLL